jgi:hypothetical protein
MISVMKRYQFYVLSPIALKPSNLLTDVTVSLSTYTNNYFTQFYINILFLFPAHLVRFLPQISEMLQEKCKFVFFNGFYFFFKFQLIYFVTEKCSEQLI